MSKPLVSVIMINCNMQNYLKASIGSYLKQTYPNKELIIVDDGSTDRSKEMLIAYEKKHEHIKVFLQPHCGSLPKLWNFANKKTSGKYVLNLDSDDILYSDAIETLVEEAESGDYDVCFGSMVYMDKWGSPLQPDFLVGAPYEPGRLIKQMYLSPPRLYKRNLFNKTSWYNEALSPADDWDLYLQMEEISTSFSWTGMRPLYCYRRHNESYSNTADKKAYQAARNAVRKNAIKRRNVQRILVIGKKWDERYIIKLRKEGNDVITFFEDSPEKSYLEQYAWFRASYKTRLFPHLKLWLRFSKFLRKFRGDLIIIKEELPLAFNLLIHLKTKHIPKKRLY